MRQTYLLARSESLATTVAVQYEKACDTHVDDRRQPDNTPMPKDEFNEGDVDALYAWSEQLEWNEQLFDTDHITTV
jgi:hypothetical protein